MNSLQNIEECKSTVNLENSFMRESNNNNKKYYYSNKQ